VANAQRTRLGPWRGLRSSLLLALVAIAASAPAPAHAAVDLGAAVRTAKSVFPSVTQRCGVVGVEIGPLSVLNAGASAESYFSSCRVRIAPRTMTSASNAQMCSLMVHEWGHLAGLEHASDPNHFMHERVPHNPVCGLSDEEARARLALESSRELRRDAITEKLSELRDALRSTRKAQRRARGKRRARLASRAKRLEKRIKRLKAELRSL
jgi:hypothetical protein